MRRATFAPMCWRNVIATAALDTGPVQLAGVISTRSASGSENVPLVRLPGSETLSVASPAVLMTLAVEVAVYSRSTPGTNAPKLAGVPSVRLSVAGTVPPTGRVPRTVTVNDLVAVLPWASLAVQVTIVCPIVNAVPEAGAQLISGVGSSLSETVGVG